MFKEENYDILYLQYLHPTYLDSFYSFLWYDAQMLSKPSMFFNLKKFHKGTKVCLHERVYERQRNYFYFGGFWLKPFSFHYHSKPFPVLLQSFLDLKRVETLDSFLNLSVIQLQIILKSTGVSDFRWLGSLVKPVILVLVWINQGQWGRIWSQVRVDFVHLSLQKVLILQNQTTQTHTHTHYSTHPTPTSCSIPPLSSCSDRWLLGVWGEHDSTAAQRAPLGSFWWGVPSQACRSAPGPAPTSADALRDPQVADEKTLWSLKAVT